MKGYPFVALTAFCISALLIAISGAQPQSTSFVDFQGFRFAAIDNVSPSETENLPEVLPFSVSSGYFIATRDEATIAAASTHPWGADCLILADGSSVPTSTGVNCTGSWLVALQQGDVLTLRPASFRVLLRRPLSALTSVTPNLIPRAGRALITIAGRDFGTGSDATTVQLGGVAATVVSQSTSAVVVLSGAIPSGATPTNVVVVETASYGQSTAAGLFSYRPVGVVTKLIPSAIPMNAVATVTIQGTDLVNAANEDGVQVTFGTTPVSRIVSVNETSIVVETPPMADSPSLAITVSSVSQGVSVGGRGLTVFTPGRMVSVSPNKAVASASGTLVTITGSGFTDGTAGDVTSVSLAGAEVPIVTVTTSTIIVRLAGNGQPSVGNVEVVSQSRAVSALVNAFEFLESAKVLSVLPQGGSIAGDFTVTVTGTHLSNGSDIVSATVAGQAAVIRNQTDQMVVLYVAPQAVRDTGRGPVTIVSTQQGTTDSPQIFAFHADTNRIFSVSPSGGPSTGGTVVTLQGSSFSNGSDVYSVTIAGAQTEIQSQDATHLVVQTFALGAGFNLSAPANIEVVSLSVGLTRFRDAFLFFAPGVITGLQPSTVGSASHASVTISGQSLGSGLDITAVLFGNVSAPIKFQNSTSVVVTVPDNVTVGTVPVFVMSVTRGTMAYSTGVRLVRAIVDAVVPKDGSAVGGALITISGVVLGSGSDITSVTIDGASAVIVNQTTSQVVVRSPPRVNQTDPSIGVPVAVLSTSVGVSNLTLGYTYYAIGSIASIEPSVIVTGSTATVTIQGVNLGLHADVTAVAFGSNVQRTILNQTDSTVVVNVPTLPLGAYDIRILSNSQGNTTRAVGLTVSPGLNLTSVQPLKGSEGGGNFVTVFGTSLGSGSDITSVLIGGVPAVITSQTTTSVTVVSMPGRTGFASIDVYSSSTGHATLTDAYVRTAGGRIFDVTPKQGTSAGSDRVTITGIALGAGNDIVAVQFGAVRAVVLAQTADSAVVSTGIGGGGWSNVSVVSASLGTVTQDHAFFVANGATSPITNYVTFGGMQFAALDNTPVAATVDGCQSSPLPLPPGWSLAADNEISRALFLGQRVQFGTDCLVLASGASIHVVTADECEPSGALVTTPNNQYGVASCDRRVLISRPSGGVDDWVSNVTITRFQLVQGILYATLDNIEPWSQVTGCQDVPIALPAGWRIADSSPATQDMASAYDFGTDCVLFGDPNRTPSARAGRNCGRANIMSSGRYYAVSSCNARILIQATASNYTTPVGVYRSVQAKILVITISGGQNEDEFTSFVAAMNAHNIPYDVYAGSGSTNPAILDGPIEPFLYASNTSGNYNAIVVTRGSIVQGSASLKASLNEYCRQFRVRLAYMQTTPQSDAGVDTLRGGSTDNYLLSFSPSYRNNPGIPRSGLNRNISLPTTVASVRFPATVSDTTLAKPVMEFSSTANAPLGTAAAEIDYLDGRVELHMYFGHSAGSLHSQVMMHFWVPWVTRAMFVGTRRVMLSTQVDDLFLSTDDWNTVTNSQNNNNFFRLAPSDLQTLHDYVYGPLRALLPPGSTYRPEFAFNGFGAGTGGTNLNRDALFVQAQTYVPDFFWESHTFTHLDLTAIGTPLRPTTYAETDGELKNNIPIAEALIGDNTQYWSANAMVTPGISGLMNGNALRAILDNGIQYVVGDNSHPEFLPANPYRCLNTTVAKNGAAGVIIVPRYPTNIFYDVSLPAEDQSQYNFIYKAATQRTFAQIIQSEWSFTASMMLAMRQDAYMFHQANCRQFSYVDPVTNTLRNHSLLSLWVTGVVQTVTQYLQLPIVSYKHSVQGDRCVMRMFRDTCTPTVRFVINPENQVEAAVLRTAGGCKVDVTGISAATFEGDVEVEVYGPDVTSFVPTVPNVTRIVTLATPTVLF